jgi:hypothetical protein
VVTPVKSVTPIVTEADFVVSALLFALIVKDPAAGEENVADVAVCPVNVPPEVVHVTPALPTSLVTTAVNGSVWEMTTPPRWGEMEMEIGAGGGV